MTQSKQKPKYDISIVKIDPKRHHGYRYQITVWWDKARDHGDVSWAYTLWGSHRQAKKIIQKHELPEEKVVTIEEYKL